MKQRHIVLIACGKKKAVEACPARELYQGDLFKKSFRYALSLEPTAIRILSAKHHVVDPDDELEPYDLTLNGMSADEIRAWAKVVLRQLSREFDLELDRFTILAGASYRRYLVGRLANFDVPLKGLGIGKQLQFLNRHTP